MVYVPDGMWSARNSGWNQARGRRSHSCIPSRAAARQGSRPQDQRALGVGGDRRQSPEDAVRRPESRVGAAKGGGSSVRSPEAGGATWAGRVGRSAGAMRGAAEQGSTAGAGEEAREVRLGTGGIEAGGVTWSPGTRRTMTTRPEKIELCPENYAPRLQYMFRIIM
jgi:hypothetical protein